MRVYHILNGDALNGQFPTDHIYGELIIARECLVDGDVDGETLEEFFATRATSLVDLYGPLDQDYYEKVVPEINKILDISEGEVNFWFVCSLLTNQEILVNLVRPTSSLQYGFGGMDKKALVAAYHQKTQILTKDLDSFSSLWLAYQEKNEDELHRISNQLLPRFPFLKEAVKAQIERGIQNEIGRPEKALLRIMEELGHDFKLVFSEFCKREPIYGFGDLQVKRLFDKLTSK